MFFGDFEIVPGSVAMKLDFLIRNYKNNGFSSLQICMEVSENLELIGKKEMELEQLMTTPTTQKSKGH